MKIKLEGCLTVFLVLVGSLSTKESTELQLGVLVEEMVNKGMNTLQDDFKERVEKLEDLAKIGTLRSCAEYTKHGLKKNGRYMIDPDGALQGQEPFQAYCDFISGATEVFHDTESSTVVDHCQASGCYNKSITYINGQDKSPISLSHIISLIELAEYCTQEITYDCTLAPLNDNDVDIAYWEDRHGEANIYFTGSNYGYHVCGCHYDEDGCIYAKFKGNKCNCDANFPMPSSDTGIITNTTALPVSKMFFGGLIFDLQKAAFKLGRLKCYGERVIDLATSCSALKRKGILQSGYYHVKAANDKHATLVFCDMQSSTYYDVPQQNQLSKQSALNLLKIGEMKTNQKEMEVKQMQSALQIAELEKKVKLLFAQSPSAQCSKPYKTLREAWRKTVYTPGGAKPCNYKHCDQDNFTPGWYRFVEPAGVALPIAPPSSFENCEVCQTAVSAWIKERKQPLLGDGIMDLNFCFAFSGDTCYKTNKGKAIACQEENGSGYFLYFLNQTPFCHLAYCSLAA